MQYYHEENGYADLPNTARGLYLIQAIKELKQNAERLAFPGQKSVKYLGPKVS